MVFLPSKEINSNFSRSHQQIYEWLCLSRNFFKDPKSFKPHQRRTEAVWDFINRVWDEVGLRSTLMIFAALLLRVLVMSRLKTGKIFK
jgi:hypothetical protein